jgi:C1A family cysteine protease
VAAAFTLHSLSTDKSAPNREFEAWKTKYGKEYTALEETYRLTVWLENLAFVESHNARYRAGLEDYEVEMNMFADMNIEEFGAKYLIRYPENQVTSKCTGPQAPADKIPDEANWTAKGAVTGVKNQGQCGSCWAFSSTGSLEGEHFRTTGELISFSEQQLVDCSKSYGNQGCNGGLMNLSFFYVKDHGITLESKYSYHGTGGTCKYNEETDKAWTINDCTEVTGGSEKALLAAVAQQPVSVAIQANQAGFQLYKKGVFSGTCGHKLDHGVLAVGFGLDKDSGKKYWDIKNSWGAGWGKNGHILLVRNGDGNGQCGIQLAASFPIYAI